MFTMTRYDPLQGELTGKKKKRKKASTIQSQHQPLHASEVNRIEKRKTASSKKRKKVSTTNDHDTVTSQSRSTITTSAVSEKGIEQAQQSEMGSLPEKAAVSPAHLDNDDQSSSSAPSTDDESDSSSSAPSESSVDSMESDDRNAPLTTLRVLAPEQQPSLQNQTLRKSKRSMEEMDDFDIADDIIFNKTTGLDQSETTNIGDMNQKKKETEISRAIKVSSLPITQAAKLWKLAPFLVNNLERNGFKSFFPIQAMVIPDIIESERHMHIRSRDICVSAPTGSGKTLTFVLPILNSLASRRVKRLRALVVLPSRDLAAQVYRVFDDYSKGSDLTIGLAIGQNDNFTLEQERLIVGNEKESKERSKYSNSLSVPNVEDGLAKYILDPLDHSNVLRTFDPDDQKSRLAPFPALGVSHHYIQNEKNHLTGKQHFSTTNGGKSAIDVLVCTPGRLMDHLEKTPLFTLQHLKYLIIDEADRLVNQSYQNWIERVVNAATQSNPLKSDNTRQSLEINQYDPVTWRRGAIDQSYGDSMDTSVCQPVQLRKLLFSATLTKDPQKLSSLGLINAKYFDAHHLNKAKQKYFDSSSTITSADMEQCNNAQGQHHTSTSASKYSLPDQLSEFSVECTAEQKPLVLLALILEHRLMNSKQGNDSGITVVFTSSVDSTHRLTRLLQLMWMSAGHGPCASIAEFSSALNQKQRTSLLARCKNNGSDSDGDNDRVCVIVCSDGMARGLDISSVTTVINYDIPQFAKTYVHRCGRTARAGQAGSAISIMKGGQVGSFRKMRQLIDNPEGVKTKGIKVQLIGRVRKVYGQCLRKLREIISAEEQKKMSTTSTIEM